MNENIIMEEKYEWKKKSVTKAEEINKNVKIFEKIKKKGEKSKCLEERKKVRKRK